MDILLTEIEARVLGALIEKEITTPDYYPLSLNALVNACNQKSNRDPVMNLDGDAVARAMRNLNEKELAGPSDNFDSRVRKYEHHLQEAFNFNRLETAILCELLLRNRQTPGELRSRAERMHHFDELSEVLSTLERLIQHDPPLVKILPRQPGTKEARYTHLLSGDVEIPEVQAAPGRDAAAASASASTGDRLARAESEIAELKEEIAALKQQFADFQKQFE
ncbi:MAG: YceH family protein [Candidatus Acidiferrales bacterium]